MSNKYLLRDKQVLITNLDVEDTPINRIETQTDTHTLKYYYLKIYIKVEKTDEDHSN